MANEPVIFGTAVVQQLRDMMRKVFGELMLGGQAPGTRNTGSERHTLLGKTTAEHAKGDTQDVDIYSGDTLGSETATGRSVQAYNRFADLEEGKWVHLKSVTGRGMELSAAECSE